MGIKELKTPTAVIENPKLVMELAEKHPENYYELFDLKPDDGMVRINEKLSNAKYLPIGKVEQLLNSLFMRRWKTEHFHYEKMINEITGSLELWIWDPVLKDWIVRSGTASIAIQGITNKKKEQKAGKATWYNVDYNDNTKYINTIQKDLPHMKAECIKNAAKSLGKIFGSDLNRDEMEVYDTVDEIMQAVEALESASTLEDLMKTFKELPADLQKKHRVKKLFTTKKLKLDV